MQQIIQPVKILVLVAVLLFTSASPALAKDVYYLVHEPSGLCPKGFFGESPKLESCIGSLDQRYYAIDPGSVGYHITSEGTINSNLSDFDDACWYPEGGEAPSNDARIAMTRDKCNLPGARFRLREDNSIEHVSSGKCIHVLGGSAHPDPGTPLVLYDGCGEDRLAFRTDYADVLDTKEYSAEERVALMEEVMGACDEIGATCATNGNSSVSFEDGDWVTFRKSCSEIGGIPYSNFVFTGYSAGCDLSKNYYIVTNDEHGANFYVYDKSKGKFMIL